MGGDQEGYSILLVLKSTNEQDVLIPKYGLKSCPRLLDQKLWAIEVLKFENWRPTYEVENG